MGPGWNLIKRLCRVISRPSDRQKNDNINLPLERAEKQISSFADVGVWEAIQCPVGEIEVLSLFRVYFRLEESRGSVQVQDERTPRAEDPSRKLAMAQRQHSSDVSALLITYGHTALSYTAWMRLR